MPYIGNQPSESFTSFATQEFSTSATTSYTLDHAVTNENEIALFINNVRQQPGSGKAYTATGTALTLSAATASTDTMYCVFLGRALQTVTPATNSITAAMVGNDLISGKDALTSSAATTDEFLISDAGTLKRIDAQFFQNTPAFEAKLSGNQAFSDSSDTIIQFNTERFDTDGMFNTSTYTWTPTVAGKYFVYCTALVKSDDISQMNRTILNILQNGSTNYTEAEFRPQGNAGSTYSPTINAVIDFNGSSDNVKMQIFADVTSSSPAIQASGSLFGAFKLTGI